MKIAHLPKSTLADTAGVLRAIADEIDAGIYGKVLASVLVLQGDTLETFGSGCGDYYRCLALLEMGKFKMLGGEE